MPVDHHDRAGIAGLDVGLDLEARAFHLAGLEHVGGTDRDRADHPHRQFHHLAVSPDDGRARCTRCRAPDRERAGDDRGREHRDVGDGVEGDDGDAVSVAPSADFDGRGAGDDVRSGEDPSSVHHQARAARGHVNNPRRGPRPPLR
ncbi:MAG: hypothetical protein R2715_05500 [Ilumatobacteraceae bacterium]